MDVLHILLLLPFLLDGHLADVVLEYNREHPLNPVFDPSSELIGIKIFLLNGSICMADGIHQRTRWISRPLAPSATLGEKCRLCIFVIFQRITHILHI